MSKAVSHGERQDEEVIPSQLSPLLRSRFERATKTPLYLLNIYYDGKLGKAIMEFLGEDGRQLVKIPDPYGHRPYFLTDEDEEKLESVLSGDSGVLDYSEIVEKINPLTMQKTKLRKIVTKDPLVVKKIRSKVSRAWEAKIKYHANYIFDMELIPGMRYIVANENAFNKPRLVEPQIPGEVLKELNKLFEKEPESTKQLAGLFVKLFEEAPPVAYRASVDIEVYTPFKGRVPSAEHAEYPVISIAVAGSDGFRKVYMLAREFKNEFLYAAGDVYPAYADVEIFDSETVMILEFYRAISNYPVVLSYNGDKFDLLYLYTRSLRLGIPRSLIPIRIGEDIVRLETAIHVDLYRFFSNRAIKNYAFGGRYQEEKLEAVASALIGRRKIGFEEGVGDISAGLLIAYNLNDAEITLELTTFNGELTWKLMILLARISKTSLEELCRRQISGWIQNLVFWEHRRLGYLIPNKEDIATYTKASTRAVIEGKKYAGALVLSPPRGVFFNVVVLDIASLYPSVVKNNNLSYETVDMNWCRNRREIVDETGRVIHSVCVDIPGLTAQVTGVLRDFRVGLYKKRVKDKSLPDDLRTWYDIVQRALKVFINASYGVFGDERFSLYSPAVAESVTALGRRSFMSIVLKAAEMGIKTLYGDTDSIFVWSPTSRQLELLQRWIQEYLGLDVEVDKEFSYVIFTELRKNYLGRTKKGDVEVKGLVAKKRNTPEFVKEFFQEILNTLSRVESPEDFAMFIEWLENETRKYYLGIKHKELPLDMLVIKMTLSKDPSEYTKNKPPHVKAALQLRHHNIYVQRGDMILVVKTKGGDGYKAIQLARQHEIDPDKYIELFKSGLEQLLNALGIKWEDVAGTVDLSKYSKY
ncbi:MAG: DNA-directed DNA polymerase I [Desulfurococcaceae archaeon]